jgi:hypothetical protein
MEGKPLQARNEKVGGKLVESWAATTIPRQACSWSFRTRTRVTVGDAMVLM